MDMQVSRARDLATRAYEIGAAVLRGQLVRHGSDGWVVDAQPVSEWLADYEGRQVYLIAIAADARVSEDAVRRTCRTCGRDYEGSECPYCREVRLRLRGE